MVLIGNKCDLSVEREVTFEEGFKLANEFQLLFFETSAKENVFVEESFMQLGALVKR